MKPKKIWTESEQVLLKELYPITQTVELAELFNTTIYAVYRQAYKMELNKNEDYMNSPSSGRMMHGDTRGLKTRYSKGHIPENKGKKMSQEMYEKCKNTMFKPGSIPKSCVHFGKPYLYTRVRKNGRIERTWFIQVNRQRITYLTYLCKQNGIDTTNSIPRLKQEYNFQEPPTLDDIEVISYQKNMEANTLHRYPEELQKLILTKGSLNRQLNKMKNND